MPVEDKLRLLAKLKQLNDLREANNRQEILMMGRGAQPSKPVEPGLGIPSDRVPTSTLPNQPNPKELTDRAVLLI